MAQPCRVNDAAKMTLMAMRNPIGSIYRRFQDLSDAYVEKPGELTGLARNEVMGQFKQAAATELQDQELVRLRCELRRLIPRQETAEFQRLLEAVCRRAGEHELA